MIAPTVATLDACSAAPAGPRIATQPVIVAAPFIKPLQGLDISTTLIRVLRADGRWVECRALAVATSPPLPLCSALGGGAGNAELK